MATKLFVPRPRPNRVHRPRLRGRLDDSRHTILVSAPAGSGKSTVLADWKIASYAQKQAIKSYLSYQEEAEYVRG